MPLLKRTAFTLHKAEESAPDPGEVVYHIPYTGEVFRSEEEYLERLKLYQTAHWTCKYTGKIGLTYEQALESEKVAAELAKQFPSRLEEAFIRAVHQSTLKINELVSFLYEKQQTLFFQGESVLLRMEEMPPTPVTVLCQLDSNEVQINYASCDTGVVRVDHLMRKKQPTSRAVIRCWLVESAVQDSRGLYWIALPALCEKYGLPSELTPEAEAAIKALLAQKEAAIMKRSEQRQRSKKEGALEEGQPPASEVTEDAEKQSQELKNHTLPMEDEKVVTVEQLSRSLKKGSLRSACLEVLKDAGGLGLTTNEMVNQIVERGLKSFEGIDRPRARVYTAMKSEPAAFQHVGPSQFALKEFWIAAGRPTVAVEKKSSRFLVSEFAALGQSSAEGLLDNATKQVERLKVELKRAEEEYLSALERTKAEASTKSPVKVPRGTVADHFEKEAEQQFPFDEASIPFEGSTTNRREVLAHKSYVGRLKDEILKKRAAFVHNCWLERQRESSKGRRKLEAILNRARVKLEDVQKKLNEEEKAMKIAAQAVEKAEALHKKNVLKEEHARKLAESKAEKERQRAVSKAAKERERKFPMEDLKLQEEFIRQAKEQGLPPPPESPELPELEYIDPLADRAFGDLTSAAQSIPLLAQFIPNWSPSSLADFLTCETIQVELANQVVFPLLKFVLEDSSHINCGVRRVRRWQMALSGIWSCTPAWQEVLLKYSANKYKFSNKYRFRSEAKEHKSEENFEACLLKALKSCAFESLPSHLRCKALSELCNDALQTSIVRNALDERIDKSQALRGLRRRVRQKQKEEEAKANAKALISLGAARAQTASLSLSRREEAEVQRKIKVALEILQEEASDVDEEEEEEDRKQSYENPAASEGEDQETLRPSKRRRRQPKRPAVPAAFREAWEAVGGEINVDGQFYAPATGEVLREAHELFIHLNVAFEDPGSYSLACQATKIFGEPSFSSPETKKDDGEKDAAEAYPLSEGEMEFKGDENDRKALLAHRKAMEDKRQRVFRLRAEFIRRRKEQNRAEAAVHKQAEALLTDVTRMGQKEDEALDKKLAASAVRIAILGEDRNYARYFFFGSIFGMKAGIFVESPEGDRWRVVKTIAELDRLLETLEERGERELALKKIISKRYHSIAAALKQRKAEEKSERQQVSREKRVPHSRRAAAAAVKSMSERDLAKAARQIENEANARGNVFVASVTKMGHIASCIKELCKFASVAGVEVPGGQKKLEERVESAGHWDSSSMMIEILQDIEEMFYKASLLPEKDTELEVDLPEDGNDDSSSDESDLYRSPLHADNDIEWMESSSQDEDFPELSDKGDSKSRNQSNLVWWSDLERQAWLGHLSDAQTLAAIAYSAAVLDDRVKLAFRGRISSCKSELVGKTKRRNARTLA